MGQSPSKKMSRTRSKELSASDLADSMANTTISSPPNLQRPSSPANSSPIDMSGNGASTPRAGNRRGRKEDRASSISSFSSANGASRPSMQSNNSFEAPGSIRSGQSSIGQAGAASGGPSSLAVPNSPAIPTTNNILASPQGGLRSSLMGSSPPPSAIPASPNRSASPGPGLGSSLTVGSALTQTMSRNSMAGSSGPQVLDVDNMIGRLLEAGYSGKVTKSPPLKNAEIASVCAAAREVFLSQPTLIELSPPVKIVGDVHGQVSIHLDTASLYDPDFSTPI